MIILFFLMSQQYDFEDLYNTATTSLVQFHEEQKAAFDTLVKLGQDSLYADTTLTCLVDRFDTKSAIERHRLKDLFKAVGSGAIPWIVERIDERGSDAEDRHLKQSLWVLGEIGGEDIVAPVGEFIDDSSWQVRSSSFTALGKSKSLKARELIIEGLNDSIAWVRKSAYYALSEIVQAGDIPHLVQGIEDPYYGVRYAALHGLVRLDSSACAVLNDVAQSSELSAFYGVYGLCEINPSSEMCRFFAEFDSPYVRFLVYSACDSIADLEAYLQQEEDSLLRNFIQQKKLEMENRVE
jgi:HEAT repeat protein